jgi:hypothetical protein
MFMDQSPLTHTQKPSPKSLVGILSQDAVTHSYVQHKFDILTSFHTESAHLHLVITDLLNAGPT